MTSNSGNGGLENPKPSEAARRTRYTDEEEDFKAKCLNDLDPSHPIGDRIAAAYDICKHVPLHSADRLVDIWTVAKDLTTEDASIEARRAGFALLKAYGTHSGILQERATIFHMIIAPIHPAEASLQISALDHFTRHGADLWPIEADLVVYLSSCLDTLFPAAQEARKLLALSKAKKQSTSGRDVQVSTPNGADEIDPSRDRAQSIGHSKIGEERSLIGVFYLIEDVINSNPEVISEIQLETLMEKAILIAQQTTSRKILHGVIKILCAIAAHARVPSESLAPCLNVLCTVSKIPDLKFEQELSICFANILDPARQVLPRGRLLEILVGSPNNLKAMEEKKDRESLLHRLMGVKFQDHARSEEIRCTVLRSFSLLFQEVRGGTTGVIVFENCVNVFCEILESAPELSSSVIDSFADFAALCGAEVQDRTFNSLLSVIEAKSGMLTSDSITSANVTDQTVKCVVRLFLHCHPISASRTHRLYKLLLAATLPTKPTLIRLSAVKLLARMRCNSRLAIEIVRTPDSQGIAGTLCRTEATASSMKAAQALSTRESIQEQSPTSRQGRSSIVDIARTMRSRSATRSSNFKDQYSRPTPPLWMYNDWTKGLPEDPHSGYSNFVFLDQGPEGDGSNGLDLAPWLDVMIDVVKGESDWETYSYILVHLPSQLCNRSLASRYVGQIQSLLNVILEQLDKSTFYQPPKHTGMKGGDVALCLYHALTILLAYHELLGRRELDNLVRAFSLGINKWDRATKCCIHALAICCHEIPSVIDRHIFPITQKLAQKITQSELAVDILEFLASLARLPDACGSVTAKLPDTRSENAKEDTSFFRTIFGICIGYVRAMREQRSNSSGDTQNQANAPNHRHSMAPSERSDSLDTRQDVSAYVLALAYQVIIFWFLAIDITQRAQHVGWIAKELAVRDASGNEILEEQSQVILDMMHRTAYSDLGETAPPPITHEESVHLSRQIWLLGMSIVTVEVFPSSNISHITKRQASGSTHATYHHLTARLPEHHVPDQMRAHQHSNQDIYSVFPNHTLLQLTSTIAPIPIPLQPIKIPDDDFVQRALRTFDRIDTVDGHKAGVVYIGHGQSSEADILANETGSPAFEGFLIGLGTRVALQGAIFNTQGLDRQSNEDGTHTYAWRDRVTEIVFHVTTMMPTDLKNHPAGDRKKRHIGNDRVKIIFNDANQPFDFDTFPSDFNEVNIVITPEAHTPRQSGKWEHDRADRRRNADNTEQSPTERFGYYKVETLTSSQFPALTSAASPKVVSADALPGFIRQLALHTSVFSQVWSEVLGQGEYISSWRARLRDIKKLRIKYGNTHASANVSYPMPSDDDAPAYVEGDNWKGRLALGGMAEPDELLRGLDFTRWS